MPIEERVTGLLAELAEARPVEVGMPPAVPAAGAGSSRPDYVPAEAPTPRAGRRPLLVAAAVGLLVALIGGLLVLTDHDGRSPVVATRSDLTVDTSLLGDGRMAVVVENDLYVADGPTGEVWRLTDTGRGEEVSNVSFSHDGQWVAFTIHDESGLWVSRWDGTERHRIGRAPSTYTWSPTANELAYATQDEVRVAQADGSSRRLPLTFTVPPSPFGPVAWSPDGGRVAFLDAESRVTTLYLDDPSTGEVNVIPVAGLLAWPRDDLQMGVGAGESPAPLTVAALPTRGVPQDLAEVARGADGFKAAVTADRLVSVGGGPGAPGAVTTCELVGLTCEAVSLPSAPRGYSDPAISPGQSKVALVGGLGATDLDGYELVIADLSDRSWIDVGRIDRSRGTIQIGRQGYGVVSEAPVWMSDTALLVRVDSSSVVRIDVTTGTRTTVVDGDRFLPPADDYPGGTGLAYWSRP